ncbi:cell division protein FtsA [Heliorestis acidaminivorans]|nr:cell division FtsA domain-containing protein [Heliorestis acidaminivorans]
MDYKEDLIFALDIGTRSVVGLVAREKEESLEILHTTMEEHRTRAMLDGQIHDVVQVAKIVNKVKQALEKELDVTLESVAVAAAGRALKTAKGKAQLERTALQEFTAEDQLALELGAVQNSLQSLKEQEVANVQDYHCVGYSIVHYFLEGQAIGNLVGQRGLLAEVEVISTFLPRVVVDSLFSVLDRAGLAMKSLTLEPIAAINVVIPQNMRQLNLALVDIGAGTSDIAITAEGTIKAYAMVPIAGDEMTEAICQKYLLDFHEGEDIKRKLQALLLSGNQDEKIVFQDILGFEQAHKSLELTEALKSPVTNLAQQIAEKIIALNGKSPQALILVGGGSLTPLLPEKIAEVLNLPRERVGVRGRESLKGLSGNVSNMIGPEYVTPVGIAVTSLNHQTLSFYEVTLNGQRIRLFNMGQGTVGDVLLSAGVNVKNLHGRPGLALTVQVNGEVKILRGTLGEPAYYTVNGEEARLDSPVQQGDLIEFVEAKAGKNGQGIIQDVVPKLEPIQVVLNEQNITVDPIILMNGKKVNLETKLIDGAKIQYCTIDTVADLLDTVGQLDSIKDQHSIRYSINGEKKKVLVSTPEVTLNGQVTSLDKPIQKGDQINVGHSSISNLQIKDIVDLERWNGGELFVTVNDKEWVFSGEQAELYLDNQVATGEEWIKEGDDIVVKAGKSADLILSELLARINFNPKPPEGKSKLQIKVNGFVGDYTTAIPNRSRVELYWT